MSKAIQINTMRSAKPSDLTIFWAKDNSDGGRGAGLTGAHFHKNWADDSFRKQVLNAIAWPGKIIAGKDNDNLMTAMDLLPTFAIFAGAKVPDDRIIDGKDIWPALSRHAETPHQAFFYHPRNTLQAVRSGDCKLHRKGKRLTALYNLKTDIAENNNLIKDNPEVTKRLAALMVQFEQELKANIRPAAFIENPKPLQMP